MTPPIVPTDSDSPAAPDEVDAPTTEAAPSRPRRRRPSWWIIGAVVVALALGAAAFLIELPYYLLQPGSVRPAGERIDVTGARAFSDDGEILFTTILLSRATPALMVRAFLDDAVEVQRADEVYPDGDVDGARRENLQRMDLSKLIATRVALDHVGIDASFVADGARVLGLSEDSPADGVVRPGDVIIEVDGGAIGLPADIAEELADRAPGDAVDVVVRRDTDGDGEPDAETDVEIALGSADDGDGAVRPVLGVEVEPSDLSIESPVHVEMDSGEVSGPSAGLAWTLGIIDRLTPGALTGGRRIAVTGEIFDDGRVGPVGGLPQKVAAVKRAGIRLFLYPADTTEAEQREMRRIAGSELRLEPVATVDEAVEVLAPEGLTLPD